MSVIAANIKKAREAKSWTQEELAAAAGLPQSRISKYERKTVPSSKALVQIAAGLGVSLDTLVTGLHAKYDHARDLPRHKGDGSVVKGGEGRVGSALPSGGAIVTAVVEARVREERDDYRKRFEEIKKVADALIKLVGKPVGSKDGAVATGTSGRRRGGGTVDR